MRSEILKSIAVIVVVLALLTWMLWGWFKDHNACESAGGVYLRGFLVWHCVDGTPILYGEEQ